MNYKQQNRKNGASASIGVATKVVPFVMIVLRRYRLVFEDLELVQNLLTSSLWTIPLSWVVVALKVAKSKRTELYFITTVFLCTTAILIHWRRLFWLGVPLAPK